MHPSMAGVLRQIGPRSFMLKSMDGTTTVMTHGEDGEVTSYEVPATDLPGFTEKIINARQMTNAPEPNMGRAKTQVAAPRLPYKPGARTSGKAAKQRQAAGDSAKPAGAATAAAAPAASAVATQSSAASNGSASTAAPPPTGGAGAATAAASPATAADAATEPTTAQPQFADDDPDSPYYIPMQDTEHSLLQCLEGYMVTAFMSMTWDEALVSIPAAPTTAAAAAKLQKDVDQLLSIGHMFEAFPWQCQIAMYCVHILGQDHADTVDAIFKVLSSQRRMGEFSCQLTMWCVPRAARVYGLGHPRTRTVLEWGADLLNQSFDPKMPPVGHLAQVVFNVAKHIHGGLGWGTAVVAPVPDEEAYLKHAVLHGKAEQLLADEGEASAALAKQMLTRCLAYYESVTPHWICSQRKSRCLQQLGQAECRLPKGLAAAEARFHAGMRAAQKELGANHEITRRSTWQYAGLLFHSRRYERALSQYQKMLRLHKDALGEQHILMLQSQTAIASLLNRTGRRLESVAMIESVFPTAVHSLGPHEQDIIVPMLDEYIHMITSLSDEDRLVAGIERAKALGCDMCACMLRTTACYK